MDIEKPVRSELISHLSDYFSCFEEVDLFDVVLNKDLRCDVLAVKANNPKPIAFAFEVKKVEQWRVSDYSAALVQAFRYVGAEIKCAPSNIAAKSVDAAFVYPAPPFVWKGRPGADHELLIMSGMNSLAGHLYVGSARKPSHGSKKFGLYLGANDIWLPNSGWSQQACDKFPTKGLMTKRMIEKAWEETNDW